VSPMAEVDDLLAAISERLKDAMEDFRAAVRCIEKHGATRAAANCILDVLRGEEVTPK